MIENINFRASVLQGPSTVYFGLLLNRNEKGGIMYVDVDVEFSKHLAIFTGGGFLISIPCRVTWKKELFCLMIFVKIFFTGFLYSTSWH